MAFNHYFEAITNRSGDSLAGYFARVIDPLTGNTVPLYADANGTPIVVTSGVANMAKTDENGNLSFYNDPGTYNLDIYQPDATSFILRVPNVAMSAGQGPQGEPGPEGPPGPAGSLEDGAVRPASISNASDDQAGIRQKIGAGSDDLLQSTTARVPFASATPENLAMTPRPTLKFNFAVERALAAGVLNITTVGNSITEGAGLSYANAWVEQLVTMLRIELPGIQVFHENYAIGGRNMSQLADSAYVATAANVSPGNFYIPPPTGINSTYFPVGSITGKSWRDHVRDSHVGRGGPDIILLEHGENDGIDNIALRNSFASFEGYSQTWGKRPWFVLVSSLVPEGAFADRQDKQGFADFWQFTAIDRHYGHVNANNWYRMMRDGARRNFVPSVQEDNFAGFGDTTQWQTQNGVSFSGSTLTTQANGRAERQINARDFDLVDYFTLGSADVRWQCEARRRPGTNDVYLIQTAFSDQGDGNGGAVRLYFRDELLAASRFPAIGAGQSVRIRIKFSGPVVQVWHDNVLVASFRSNVGMYAGAVAIGTVVGGGTHAQFKLAYAPEYVEAQRGYFSASYLLNDEFHHPSADGAFKTYVRAAREFVTDFIATARRPIKLTTGAQTADKTFPVGTQQAQTDTAVTVKVSGAQYATCFIQMGYLNLNPTVGAVTLRVNGVGVTTFYLDPDPSGTTRNRQLSVTGQAPLVAGTNTIDLLYAAPQGGTVAVTSNGADNTRMLVAEVAVL